MGGGLVQPEVLGAEPVQDCGDDHGLSEKPSHHHRLIILKNTLTSDSWDLPVHTIWSSHIESVGTKAQQRLYALQLRVQPATGAAVPLLHCHHI